MTDDQISELKKTAEKLQKVGYVDTGLVQLYGDLTEPHAIIRFIDRFYAAETEAKLFQWLMRQYEPTDEIPDLRAELVKVMSREQGA